MAKEKIALVTGAGSGMGRATAIAFANSGAAVAITDVNSDSGNETVEIIRHLGGNAFFIQADISSRHDVERLIDHTVEKFGRIDWAFNNAGIALPAKPIDQYPEEDWDRTIAVDLKGVWLCMKYEFRQMLAQGGGGAIVNNSSIIGKVGVAGSSAYCAAKAGVIGLTQSAALDYAERGIRVNAICPGGIHTAITHNPINKQAMDKFTQATPMARMGDPQEIAETVIWLCSDRASYITGQAIAVDGGYGVK